MSVEEIFEIVVPRDNVNDDEVTLIEWYVGHGDFVDIGTIVADVESSKGIFEILAEDSGFIGDMIAVDETVDIGDPLARLYKQEHAIPEARKRENSDVSNKGGNESSDAYTITKAAQVLLDENNIDIDALFDQIGARRIIRSADINEYLDESERVTLVREDTEVEYKKKGLWYELTFSARDRGRARIWLIINYLFRSWFLTNIVRWIPYRLIVTVHRMRGVRIGEDCFIAPTAILESAYPENIRIGNDVRIADNAIVMTHIKPPHYQIENKISKIVHREVIIEDYAFIGLNAIITPGVTVGESSVVASGSVVTQDVSAYTLVAGNPAQIVRQLKRR